MTLYGVVTAIKSRQVYILCFGVDIQCSLILTICFHVRTNVPFFLLSQEVTISSIVLGSRRWFSHFSENTFTRMTRKEMTFYPRNKYTYNFFYYLASFLFFWSIRVTTVAIIRLQLIFEEWVPTVTLKNWIYYQKNLGGIVKYSLKVLIVSLNYQVMSL